MHDLSTGSWLTKYSLRGVLRDPGTMMIAGTAMAAGGIGATGIGGVLSAKGTLAGGDYAAMAGEATKTSAYGQAKQLEDNAAQSFASAQRQALETRSRTNLAISSSRARAGASGVDAGSGSPLENEANLAQRGSYHALMEMFNGESEATGMRNQAAATRYSGDLAAWEGQTKKKLSKTQAMATLAATAGSMLSQGGKLMMPTPRGAAGASV